MRKITLCNAFSLQMLSDAVKTANFTNVSVNEMIELVKVSEVVSAIGHPDTARVISNILGVEICPNRINVHLNVGDSVYVAQVMGGRLPEGATTLPENFEIKFIKVTVQG